MESEFVARVEEMGMLEVLGVGSLRGFVGLSKKVMESEREDLKR